MKMTYKWDIYQQNISNTGVKVPKKKTLTLKTEFLHSRLIYNFRRKAFEVEKF